MRDDPSETPAPVVYEGSATDGTLRATSATLFGVVLQAAKAVNKGAGIAACFQPRKAAVCKEVERVCQAAGHGVAVGDAATQRKKRVVAPTLSGVGISVPFDKKTEVGYREPSCQPYPKALVQIVQRMQAQADAGAQIDRTAIDEVVSWLNIANDECDFGAALRVGLDLWATSPVATRQAIDLLQTAYELLGRSLYAQIIEEHGKDRYPKNLARCVLAEQ